MPLQGGIKPLRLLGVKWVFNDIFTHGLRRIDLYCNFSESKYTVITQHLDCELKTCITCSLSRSTGFQNLKMAEWLQFTQAKTFLLPILWHMFNSLETIKWLALMKEVNYFIIVIPEFRISHQRYGWICQNVLGMRLL